MRKHLGLASRKSWQSGRNGGHRAPATGKSQHEPLWGERLSPKINAAQLQIIEPSEATTDAEVMKSTKWQTGRAAAGKYNRANGKC